MLWILALACTTEPTPAPTPAAPAPGVDREAKTITVLALTDLSGPGSAMGERHAAGVRAAVAWANAELLSDGWSVVLVEADHGYNPQNSVQAYNQHSAQVLFVVSGFGTPNVMPLIPMLGRDCMPVVPTSQSSLFVESPNTLVWGPTDQAQAQAAFGWAKADNASLRPAIVRQMDDYGDDALSGWTAAAEAAGIELLKPMTVAPGQRDMSEIADTLVKAGATHVLVATDPNLAQQLRAVDGPVWIGARMAAPLAPTDGALQLATGPAPGSPEHAAMVTAWTSHGAGALDAYAVQSFIDTQRALEATVRAQRGGDLSREGVAAAMRGTSERALHLLRGTPTGWETVAELSPGTAPSR